MELIKFSMTLLFSVLLMAASASASASASSYISDGVLESQASFTGRNLLQAKKSCSVNFEFFNYTILRNRCKGPKYPPVQCCSALKDLACPYSEQINDLSTDCATTMFSYINLYGKYPPGLFANQCKEGKEGLTCPSLPPSVSKNVNGSHLRSPLSLMVIVTTAFLAFITLLRDTGSSPF